MRQRFLEGKKEKGWFINKYSPAVSASSVSLCGLGRQGLHNPSLYPLEVCYHHSGAQQVLLSWELSSSSSLKSQGHECSWAMYWKHWVRSSFIQDHSNISIFHSCSQACVLSWLNCVPEEKELTCFLPSTISWKHFCMDLTREVWVGKVKPRWHLQISPWHTAGVLFSARPERAGIEAEKLGGPQI